MTERRNEYGGSELFSVLDAAGEQLTDPNLHAREVGNQIQRVLSDYKLPKDHGIIDDGGQGQRQPGTDVQDPYGSVIKPKNVPVWTKVPETEAEKSLYIGNHLHSETNPMGLHSHVIGGKLGGGHSHGPASPHGVHFHGEMPKYGGKTLDGRHVHPINENKPTGGHSHSPASFG
jgi:hypothetical protein